MGGVHTFDVSQKLAFKRSQNAPLLVVLPLCKPLPDSSKDIWLNSLKLERRSEVN
jgi:hypothetical protein